jgi:hypothetical protein
VQWIRTLVARAGSDPPPLRDSKRQSFETLLIAGLVSESWRTHAQLFFAGNASPLADAAPLALTTLAGLAAVPARTRRVGLGALFALQLAAVVASFPQTANHAYLQCELLALLLFLDPRVDAEQELAQGALRWIFLAVFVWAGLQKLVHGYYFRGEYFAFYLDVRSFDSLLRHFISDAELARFGPSLARTAGSGPYRFESLPMIALSNLGYVAELGIPVLLLAPRWRRVAVCLGVVFLCFTEALARELHFGALYLSGLLLFWPGDANRRLFPLYAALYAWMLLTSLRVFPEVLFF